MEGSPLRVERERLRDEIQSIRDEILKIKRKVRMKNEVTSSTKNQEVIKKIVLENKEDKIDIVIDDGLALTQPQEENPPTPSPPKFKNFDIIKAQVDDEGYEKSIKDHYYYDYYAKDTKYYTNPTKTRIMEEKKILEKSLPPDSNIYVKGYEARIGLLRAVIIGQSGTPYQDGLFFFDIYFPPDYPNLPPMFYYHSFGFNLNPNLHPNNGGEVCTSLLNISDQGAQNNEKYWNPSQSNLFQVLLFIQAFVLNDKPYFNNTPGPSITIKTGDDDKKKDKLSLDYNREVFHLSCKTMLSVLATPPNHFEEFVSHHFRCRANTILTSYKAYREDYPSSKAIKATTIYMFITLTYLKLHRAFIMNGWDFIAEDKDDWNFMRDDIFDYYPRYIRDTIICMGSSGCILFLCFCLLLALGLRQELHRRSTPSTGPLWGF